MVQKGTWRPPTKFSPREFLSKDTRSSSGPPVSVSRRDTVQEGLALLPVQLTPISFGFTGFKLVFCILLYNSVSLCFSPPTPLHPLLNSLIPVSNPCTYASQAKQCSDYHTTQKEQMRNTQTSLNLHLVTQENKSQWYLSQHFGRGKQEPIKATSQPNQEKFHKECILSFYILMYKPSTFSEMISLFKKKRKTIYTRLLAQGVKIYRFFLNTQKKATSGVFYLSTLLLCFPQRFCKTDSWSIFLFF